MYSFHLWLVSNLLRLLLARVICCLLCNVAAVLCAAAAAAAGGGVWGKVSLLCTPFICGLSAIFFACYELLHEGSFCLSFDFFPLAFVFHCRTRQRSL